MEWIILKELKIIHIVCLRDDLKSYRSSYTISTPKTIDILKPINKSRQESKFESQVVAFFLQKIFQKRERRRKTLD